MKWRYFFFFLVFAITAAAAQDVTTRDYQIKSVFLFNFSQFVSWPADAFAHPEAPLVIGVVGDDPFGGYLEKTVAGETLAAHPLTVRHFATVNEVSDCHILFVNIADAEEQRRLLDGLRHQPVLTVSDHDGFIGNGGMVRFYNARNKVRLRINHHAAEQAGLSISSRLLQVADLVSENR